MPYFVEWNLTVAVQVVDYAGIPIPGVPVSLGSELGSFSEGAVVVIRSDGVASSRLEIHLEDFEGIEIGDVFVITATTDGLDGPIVDSVPITVF